MFCAKCGAEQPEGAAFCAACGTRSGGGDPAGAGPGEGGSDVLHAVVPTKNPKALLAYYLGVFSVIPCVGSPLGIAAFFLGLKGLKFAKANPAARGAVHAWIGILVGGLFGLLWTVAAVMGIVALLAGGTAR
jgi:zinc ribbon protein